MKLGLALSGGGFRATLYHLGVVKFLRDAQLLREVSHICAVSGGSILAAHLVQNWDAYNGSEEEFCATAKRVIDFSQRDIRGRILRRAPLGLATMLIPTRWTSLRLTRDALFQRLLDLELYDRKLMHELPDKPRLHLLTTNLTKGQLCSFTREGLSVDIKQYGKPQAEEVIASNVIPIGLAVAASAAFPGMIPPVRLTAERLGVDREQFRPSIQYLVDGGVFDNLGARKLRQLHDVENFDRMFLSNASGNLNRFWENDQPGILRTAARSADILLKRISELEEERIELLESQAANKTSITVPIQNVVPEDQTAGILQDNMQRQLKHIRTDLNVFSKLEVKSLIRHGYTVAREVTPEGKDQPPFDGFPKEEFSPGSPKEIKQLRKGRWRRLHSLINLRDPATWILLLWTVVAIIAIYYLSQADALDRLRGVAPGG